MLNIVGLLRYRQQGTGMVKQIVAVCVCTYQRPNMLRDCLSSLVGQHLGQHPDFEPVLVVVDNNPPQAEEVVRAVAHCTSWPVVYVPEPHRGIASARNAALNAAMGIDGVTWIAFTDDDELAEPGWLAALMAPEYRDTPILSGGSCNKKEGETLKTTMTRCVRFSIALYLHGLRFDTSMDLTGGEDTLFFTQAHMAGFAIRHTNRAKMRSQIHPERVGLAASIYRHYWMAISNFRAMAMRRGYAGAVLFYLPRSAAMLAIGVLEMLVSPCFVVWSGRQAWRRFTHGATRVAKTFGWLAAMAGLRTEPYRHTVGR